MKLTPRKPNIDADDNVGRGMDFALMILLFLGIGWALDARFDARPVFTIGFVIFAVVGQFVRMWYVYGAAMERHEAERRTRATAQPPSERAA
ncbi:MAG: AtpZ/AtpI family protein [Ilumatobacteraceae bacterium]